MENTDTSILFRRTHISIHQCFFPSHGFFREDSSLPLKSLIFHSNNVRPAVPYTWLQYPTATMSSSAETWSFEQTGCSVIILISSEEREKSKQCLRSSIINSHQTMEYSERGLACSCSFSCLRANVRHERITVQYFPLANKIRGRFIRSLFERQPVLVSVHVRGWTVYSFCRRIILRWRSPERLPAQTKSKK